jgi:hypothetical protein
MGMLRVCRATSKLFGVSALAFFAISSTVGGSPGYRVSPLRALAIGPRRSITRRMTSDDPVGTSWTPSNFVSADQRPAPERSGGSGSSTTGLDSGGRNIAPERTSKPGTMS